jgi:orotidine-5'-phosphate decarboxylase
MRKNIYLALDFNSLKKALYVTRKTKNYIAGIKIGLELYSVIGLKGLKHFNSFNLPIFLDTKIFDIPNQVAKTIKVVKKYKNIKYFTIHSMGSFEMLKAAKKAAIGSNLKFLAVSILTSWNKKDLKQIGINRPIKDQVKILTKLAIKSNMSGVISSPQDIGLVRSVSKKIDIFCPGIRGENKKHDQKRTLSYKEFNKISDKNSYAVIGRPIYNGDPLKNIKKIINSIR